MNETRTCRGCDTELPAQRLGRPREWCTDQCRKTTLYASRCVDCGAVCNVDGRVQGAAVRCWSCSHARQAGQAIWTRETLLDAGRRWQTMVGRQAAASDWNPGLLHDAERRALLKRLHEATGPWPPTKTVVHVFGSWNAFIQALGGEPRRQGVHMGINARTGELRALVDRLAA